MLTRIEIVLDFDSVGFRNRRVGDIPSDDDTGNQEHGTTVFAAPVARRKLQLGEELESIIGGLEGSFRMWEVGLFLRAVRDSSTTWTIRHVQTVGRPRKYLSAVV